MSNILGVLANWAQIISIPLTIIAIVVSIWLYRRGKQRRAISCTFDPVIFPIEIKAGDALKGDIEIRYKGQPIENLFVARATLKNTGNLAIRKTDFVEPLMFTFKSGTELIRQPQVSSVKPHNLKVIWGFGTTGSPAKVSIVRLEFDLFNPGDELTIEFACTGKSNIPKLTARIEGVSEIGLLDSQVVRWQNEIKSAVIPSVLAFVFAVILFGSEVPLSSGIATGSIAGATAGLLQALPPLLKLLRYRKRKSAV